MVRLMDGGMGHALYKSVGRPKGGWPATVTITHNQVVQELHSEFLRAGAEIITTNTYNAGRYRLNVKGEADYFAAINIAACEAAEAARDACNPAALIAGAIGPVRMSYQPDWVPDASIMEAEIAEQAILLAPHVDFFMVETMSITSEAVAAVKACSATGRPAWVGYSVEERGDPLLRSGEAIQNAVDALDGLPVDAVLISCTSPEAVTRARPILRDCLGKDVPFGGYANAFVTIPADFGMGSTVADLEQRAELGPDAYAGSAAEWLDMGASILGGCCEVNPPHIARLAKLIAER